MLSTELLCQFTVLIVVSLAHVSESRVIDYGPKLPEFIKNNPRKSFLIRFHTPTCVVPICDNRDLVYKKVAETIYHKHDDLIVGQVNCYENPKICSHFKKFNVKEFALLHQGKVYPYNGLTREADLVSFGMRMTGPNVNEIIDCNHLKDKVEEHHLLVLWAGSSQNYTSYNVTNFNQLANNLKDKCWFYRYDGTCDKLAPTGGIYILKVKSNHGLRSNHESANIDTVAFNREVASWIQMNSFPVFGEITGSGFIYALERGKPILLAVLDYFEPARRFVQSSSEFKLIFEKIAVEHHQANTSEFIFAWLSEIDVIEHVVMMRKLPLPNIIVIYPDMSHHLAIQAADSLEAQLMQKDPEKFARRFVELAKGNKLKLTGEDTRLRRVARGLFSMYSIIAHCFQEHFPMALICSACPICSAMILLFNSLCYLFVLRTQDRPNDERPPSGENNQNNGRQESRQNGTSNNRNEFQPRAHQD